MSSISPFKPSTPEQTHSMQDWSSQIGAYFEPAGWLQNRDARFTPRPQQAEMAREVAHAILDKGVLVVEAGTGVGKTFAYLVPALLSGQRSLISTATKTLQDQLYFRDIPRLLDQLGLPLKVALLKGRSSYICTHRLDRCFETHPSPLHLRTLLKLRTWSQRTATGDLSEVEGWDEGNALQGTVTSTRENCLGSECPHAKTCFVNLARKIALESDVTVVNHHLFFADLVIRETGQAQLLPAFEIAIFDEAHHMNQTGIQFLGVELGSGHIVDLVKDTLNIGLAQARGLQDWLGCTSRLDQAIKDMRLLWPTTSNATRKWDWAGQTPDGVDPDDWTEALANLNSALDGLLQSVAACVDIGPDFGRLSARIAEMLNKARLFATACPGHDHVRWVDVSRGIKLVESPLDIGNWMQERLWPAETEVQNFGNPESKVPARHQSGRTYVFASATFGQGSQLEWFTKPMGLSHARTLALGSPFDFQHQAALYIPAHAPALQTPEYNEHVATLALQCARVIGGRTLVLTTSLFAMREIAQMLRKHLDGTTIEVLVQGEAPKQRLIDQFRAPSDTSASVKPTNRSVLVGSVSFWEGVDIPGPALSAVIIDKLPFPSPADPWVRAKVTQIEQSGGNAFKDMFLKDASVALQQGAGRLIRHEQDHGLLVICDPRLRKMSYGRQLISALPPMRRLDTEPELMNYLQSLPYQ